MANCILCGKKIGAFEKSYGTFGAIGGVSVCADCFELLNKFHDAAENGKVDEATEFSKEFLEKYKDNKSASIISDKFLEKARNYMPDETTYHYREPEPKLTFKERMELFQQKAKEIEEKRNSFLSTTGYGFEGYRIKQYLGITTGESTIGTGILATLSTEFNDILGTSSSVIGAKLTATQEKAIAKLIDNCILLGANAVIGVEADVMSLSVNNMIVATARGTAVVIEKIEE